VTAEDRKERLNLLYHPYHHAIDAHLTSHPAKLVFSVHSFTPEYEGNKRKVEVGLLFYHDAGLATEVSSSLVLRKGNRDHGFPLFFLLGC